MAYTTKRIAETFKNYYQDLYAVAHDRGQIGDKKRNKKLPRNSRTTQNPIEYENSFRVADNRGGNQQGSRRFGQREESWPRWVYNVLL